MAQSLPITIADSVATAPTYDEQWRLVKLSAAVVVPKGTEGGNPTVDLQLTDRDGNKFVIMTTGTVLELLGQVIAGVRTRPSEETPDVKH